MIIFQARLPTSNCKPRIKKRMRKAAQAMEQKEMQTKMKMIMNLQKERKPLEATIRSFLT
jgi:hypothetical protein